MTEAIAFLSPAALAIILFRHLRGDSMRKHDLWFYYLMFVGAINVIVYAITLYLMNNERVIFTDVFFIKYTLIASVIGIIIALATNYATTSVTIEMVKNEKSKKNRKK